MRTLRGRGLAVEPGATRDVRPGARRGRGRRSRRRLLGRAGDARSPPGGHRRLRARLRQRCSGTSTVRAARRRRTSGPTRSSSRTTCPAASRTADGVGAARPRRPGPPGPVQPGRGAAAPGLRDVQPGGARRGAATDGRPPLRRRAAPLPARRAAPVTTVADPDLRRTVRRSLAHRGRADPARVHRTVRAAAPARVPLRRQRLDGAVRPRARALPPHRRDRPRAGSRRSRSAPVSPASPASCRVAIRTPRSAAAARRVVDWSGGTRLGDGLRAFNDEWGIRGMARRRHRRGDLRRLGAWGCRTSSPSRWRACTGSRTGSSG